MYRKLMYLILLCLLIGCTVDSPASPTTAGQFSPATQNVPATESATKKPQLIEFYANWCQVCLDMQPTVDTIRSGYGSGLVFNHYDVDDPSNVPLRQKYGYKVQPYFVLLDASGTVVRTWHGAVSAAEFQQAIDPLVGSSN